MNLTPQPPRLIADINVPIEDITKGGAASPYTDLGQFITNFFIFGLIITALFSFIYLIVGGFNYVTSGGDKLHVQAARERVTYAILGLAITAGAAAFFSVIGAVLGINIFNKIQWPGP